MLRSLSLTQRYILFVALVITVFVIGSLVITSSVLHTELSNQLRGRLDRSQVVLEQYANVHYLSRMREMETAATSPRFIAAVATGDSATLAEEAPTYLGILDADLMVIFDKNDQLIYASNPDAAELASQRVSLFGRKRDRVAAAYPRIGSEVYEVYCADIVTGDNIYMGQVQAGTRFSSFLAAELKRLTDFDVIVTQDDISISNTSSPLVSSLLDDRHAFSPSCLQLNVTHTMQVAGNELLLLSLPGPYSSTIITFAVSIDERIAPIMKEVTLFSILLSVIGGLISMAAIFWYTHFRIGRQIKQLVTAAERISSGDMEFNITPQSSDELGVLAREIEQMRSGLVKGRAQLEEAHAETIASERLAAIGKLTTGIIHDFKNPMAVVRASADMIRMKNKENPKIVEYCTNIHSQVDAMVELTRDVLEYSRGRTKIDFTPVRMISYLQEIVQFHAPQYREANVTLAVESGPDVELSLDKARLKRVLDNILNNAREACGSGDTVSIRWRLHDNGLRLELSDTGPGIPEEILTTLFEPFVTSGKENGTGLGLAIAKKIVEDHGGQIAVRSSQGNGTTFTIHFPSKLVRREKSEAVLS